MRNIAWTYGASLLLSVIVSPCRAEAPALGDVSGLISRAQAAFPFASTPVPSLRLEAKLETELTTYFIKDINATIKIKNLDQGGTPLWVIETWRQCPSFPCTPADFMEKTIVNPTVERDNRNVDGALVLKLNDAMTVVHQPFDGPGAKPKTDYTLLYTVDGNTMKLPLYMVSSIRTH